MEKILTPEERIRRAEEIYYRRKNEGIYNRSARVNVNSKKEFGLFKRMFLQILICIFIYSIFYMIQNTEYFFSDAVIEKTKDILAYDINIQELYNNGKEYFNSFLNKYFSNFNFKSVQENEGNIENNTSNTNTTNENIKEEENKEDVNNSNNGVGGGIKENLQNTQMDQDAKYVLDNISLIIPLEGTITSRFGLRNPETPTVPKNHTGIDIAAYEGTVFVSAMSGKVEKVSDEGDLGNHVKITDGDVSTVYAHCKKIYVKEKDNIVQGQKIGEVGSTGNSTGPHLHFEIKKDNRYVNPDLVLNFK